MRRRYRIRMAIALLIGVAIGLFGEHWLWEKKEVVVERREPVMRKLVSDSVDYGFKVSGPVVMVMPKADLESTEGALAVPKVE